jgi:putative PIN family toxin of toxin-antitoxin system
LKPVVVLDTNQWVSACLRHYGKPARILLLALEDKLCVLTSPSIWAEFVEVLQRPHIRKGQEQGDLEVSRWLAQMRNTARWTPGRIRVNAVAADPDDNIVIACAVEGKAGYIITGDRHLLALETYEGISILSPADFLILWNRMQRLL